MTARTATSADVPARTNRWRCFIASVLGPRGSGL
jgi:hypothetical protein